MANRLDVLQSSKRSQCSSTSVRTTWLYRPDAIQCLTSIRVSNSRHSYGKTAATVRTRFSISQDVHRKFNRPNVRLNGPDDQASYMEIACTSSTVRMSAFKVQMLQSFIMVITCSQSATVRKLGQHRPDAPKPYYGIYVQPKCNRPDARARPSGRGLVIEDFSAILERWLQLTVSTLGQAVRTPSGILVITFYSNIGLGRNLRRWKANKIFCKLSIWTAITSVRTASVRMKRFSRPDGPTENSRITFQTRKTWPVRTALDPIWMRVPQNPFLTRFWVSKAYK
jgi:hypothetical protein